MQNWERRKVEHAKRFESEERNRFFWLDLHRLDISLLARERYLLELQVMNSMLFDFYNSRFIVELSKRSFFSVVDMLIQFHFCH